MTAALANFHFVRPAWLLLLPVAIGLWWLWQRYSDPVYGWRQQISSDLLEALLVGKKTGYKQAAWLLLLVWIAAVIAIAGPAWRLEPSPFAEDATPLMIVLKADESMEKSDLEPSRLEHARLKIADLCAVRKGQPLGLIAYAGSAHLVLPPTRDTAIVESMAREVSSAVMPTQGDRLDLAIREAGRILREGEQGGSIVVVADGVGVEPQLLQAIKDEVSFPVQFLAVNTPGSPEDKSLVAAAKMLKASVEPLRVDGRDISAIVRRAAGSAAAVGDTSREQWQEEGYWLVPFIALLLLLGFRRKRTGEEV